MTRRKLLQALAAAPLIGQETKDASNGQAVRIVGEYTHAVNFPAADVFPLLCPVREYEWLEGWKCEVVYTVSGVAEENCVFITDFSDSGRQVWTVSRYEPDSRIEFVTVGVDLASRLNIELTESDGRTALHWTRLFTGLTEKGNQLAAAHGGSWTRDLGERLHRMMTHYLQTGDMLDQ
jgi:hypothetical protein